MTAYVVTAPLVVVRQKDGSYVHVYTGGPVPADSDADHVKLLRQADMIAKADADEAPQSSEEDGADDKPASVKDILADVGDDKDKAAAALEAENARGDDARSSLVKKLEAIVEGS